MVLVVDSLTLPLKFFNENLMENKPIDLVQEIKAFLNMSID